MTCAQMGGPATCTAVMSGNTPEELVEKGMAHLNEVHPEMATTVKAMTKEETDKWMADFRQKWDALPEMPA